MTRPCAARTLLISLINTQNWALPGAPPPPNPAIAASLLLSSEINHEKSQFGKKNKSYTAPQ
jgi:hypothetical protein